MELQQYRFTLFPTVEEQKEYIALAAEGDIPVGNILEQPGKDSAVEALQPGRAVPEDVIDGALTGGGNERGSVLRIIAFFQKGPSLDDAADFLEGEYGTGGRGITVNGVKYALWFNEEGIRIAKGRTVRTSEATFLSWEEAAGRVYRLLKEGRYAPKEAFASARENEYKELAAQLWYLRQELSDDGVRRGFLPRLSEIYMHGGFPKDTEILARHLRSHEGRQVLLEELEEFAGACGKEPELLRFRTRYSPAYLAGRIRGLSVLPVEFPAVDGIKAVKGSFITEDEIDYMLADGSGISEGKIRIYSCFMQKQDARQREKFLKGEYGTGGRGFIGYDEWHDAKGIRLSRDDEGSGGRPYDTVRLSWDKVEKWIGKLTAEERYLNASEKAFLPEYEKRQLARHIQGFYDSSPGHVKEPVFDMRKWEKEAAGYREILDDPEKCRELYEDMVKVFALVSPDDARSYGIMSRAMEAVTAFQEGRYSLFTPPSGEMLKLEALGQKEEKAVSPEAAGEKAEREPEAPVSPPVIRHGKSRMKEERNGQLSFDFLAMSAAESEAAGDVPDKEDAKTPLPEGQAEPGLEEARFRENVLSLSPKQDEAEEILAGAGTISEISPVETGAGQAAEGEAPLEAGGTVPENGRRNYRITDENYGTGSQKVKYQNNIEAVRMLKEIEAQGRLASPGEQEILSRYVGWGGIAQAFDLGNDKWAGEYAELKGLLTKEEYESARSTVLNAHYTSPAVISAMYQAVENMGIVPGNILEPSCAIGNFFGLLPEKFAPSSLYGVELDGITGRIARQLYQKADIAITGFENSDFPDDFFDLAIGNVPFGGYKVHDKRYDKQNLLIHDYFLVKTLDKVRPGGIMAFVTSKGTMDKMDSHAREELARKGDLLGAVRLPNNAFKANAGTEVTTDILFFQKRGSAPEKLPAWVETGMGPDGILINRYFLQHPEMVLGRMEIWKGRYGGAAEAACLPIEGADLKEQLAKAAGFIKAPDKGLLSMDAPGKGEGKQDSIPADPSVRNFSYTEKDGKIYFRENSRMLPAGAGKTAMARIRGLMGIRDSTRRLIDLQMQGAGDGELAREQERLNLLYDKFQLEYGLINSTGNRLAFRQDSSYPLLCSLEVLDGEGNFKGKADMFTKRTIKFKRRVERVDTAVEALGVSVGEKACVDIKFMASLMGGGAGTDVISRIVSDLKGIIFKDPDSGPFEIEGEGRYRGWLTADAYLSGNVRRKLEKAREAAEKHPEFSINVEALLKVQPKDLAATEISVRIGAPWIDSKYYREFMFSLFHTPGYLQYRKIDVLYSDITGEWCIKGKSEDSINNLRIWNTYGTKRINGYAVFEACLNQRTLQVFDTVERDGREMRVLNEKETAMVQQKQEAVKEAFRDWIFREPERRNSLCAAYNHIFNAVRPREYDGQHLVFNGMNPEIRLETHQRNAVARILYGGNTLLAHVVGAGKTFEMAAAAMESRRLGLCRKSMFVVPNHLTEQWGSDFLTLYPGAKILVATKKDFEPANRRRFCARIATGDFDAVIIGHSQFESTTCC